MPDRKYLCQYIERYLDKELKVSRNMTRSGYKSYVLTLNLFLGHSSEKLRCKSDKIESADLSFESFYDFMTDLSEERSWSAATWNVRLAGIKSFLRFLSLENPWFLETYNRVKFIKTKRLPRRDPFYLTRTSYTSIVEAFSPRNWTQFRDYTMVQFMVATGLRVSEVSKLKVKDVLWLSSKKVHIRFKGKGRKKRVLPLIDTTVLHNLRKLLNMSDVNSKYVFPGNSGSRMSISNLADRIDRFFSPHKLDRKVTPHVLRRSAAMNWLSMGMDIFHVSAMLGHEQIATTEKYLRSNLEDRETELRRVGIDAGEFQPFKPSQDVDGFLESLRKKVRKKR